MRRGEDPRERSNKTIETKLAHSKTQSTSFPNKQQQRLQFLLSRGSNSCRSWSVFHVSPIETWTRARLNAAQPQHMHTTQDSLLFELQSCISRKLRMIKNTSKSQSCIAICSCALHITHTHTNYKSFFPFQAAESFSLSLNIQCVFYMHISPTKSFSFPGYLWY